jgi:hypothetical protein
MAAGVCAGCGGRIARLIVTSSEETLSELWHMPRDIQAALTAPAGGESEGGRYDELGLLDDALFEAGQAYWEISDEEVRREALAVVMELLKDDAMEKLRAALYPV